MDLFDPKMLLKWCPDDPQNGPRWSSNGRNWSPDDVHMIPMWPPNDPQMTSKWCPNWSLIDPIIYTFPMIFVNYSPGDRAQKVIPGGAKTNESFWKSQNNVKKSILRFPSFMFTIALVIFIVLLVTFGTPWKPFGAPLDAKWRWRPNRGITQSFATKTSKFAQAFIKKWKGVVQNSSASTIFLNKLKN